MMRRSGFGKAFKIMISVALTGSYSSLACAAAWSSLLRAAISGLEELMMDMQELMKMIRQWRVEEADRWPSTLEDL